MILCCVFRIALLPVLAVPIFGYRFSCLDFQDATCECDTDEELIDCNSREWTQFPKLTGRLRGFSVMSLGFNKIKGDLPDEAEVLKRLPDLELLDLRGNDKLDCDEILAKFDRIKVHSHCVEKELQKGKGQTSKGPAAPYKVPWSKPTSVPFGRHNPRFRPFIPTIVAPIWPLNAPVQPTPMLVPVPNLCTSLWCRMEQGARNVYSTVYVNVHSVWTKMKREFMARRHWIGM